MIARKRTSGCWSRLTPSSSKAIENDCYKTAECVCCESTIFCIQNADYVLCPECRVVSRKEGVSSRGMGDVGLGFKHEDLARWQDPVLKEQLRRSSNDEKAPAHPAQLLRSADDV